MLNRSQVITMLALRNRSGNLFSTLPIELIQRIQESPTADQDFLEALHHVAYGELDALESKLEQIHSKGQLKALLLQAGDVVTPSGVLVKGKTLLECALGAGDPEIVANIKSRFSLFSGDKEMENQLESQLERYRPCIESIETKLPIDECFKEVLRNNNLKFLIKQYAAFYAGGDPAMKKQIEEHPGDFASLDPQLLIGPQYDVVNLIDIIRESSRTDILAELARGDTYDKTYHSLLRKALNKFRENLLKPSYRTLTKPSMHCHYQNLIYAYHALRVCLDLPYQGVSLVLQQIIGFIQLVELPAYERYAFIQGSMYGKVEDSKILRSFDNNYFCPSTFLLCDLEQINARVGLGFDSYADMGGHIAGGHVVKESSIERIAGQWLQIFQKHLWEKKSKLMELVLPRIQHTNQLK